MSFDHRESIHDKISVCSVEGKPIHRTTTYSYLSTGPSATKQQPNGDVISYTYDALDRLVTTVYSDSTRVTLAYDAVGRTTTMADSTGTATYVYDAVNRLTDKTEPGSLRQQYSYDAVGNRTRLVEPNGNVRTFTYDNMDRVSVFIDPEAKKTTLQYDAVGRNTTILFQSGLRFLNGFDAAGQQTLSRADYGGDPSLKSNFFYSYDGVGNRTGYTDTVFDSVQTMTYDAKNRLTRWQGNVISAKDYAYTYDEIDNRLTDTETGVVRTWTYDASSRLTTMSAGGATTSFAFDTNGNMTNVNESGTLSTLAYDKENRMTSYSDVSGTTLSKYNGYGQKVASGSTTLVWDGFDYLGEVNGGTFDCETFTVDGQILAEKRAGTERLDFESTALGSVCTKYDQTNQARAGVQRYKPYGAHEFHDSTLPTWQFVGKWGYRPTGLSWSDYYLRSRDYGTAQASFTSRDRVWPFTQAYGYVRGNPTTLTDMYGFGDEWKDIMDMILKWWGRIIFELHPPVSWVIGGGTPPPGTWTSPPVPPQKWQGPKPMPRPGKFGRKFEPGAHGEIDKIGNPGKDCPNWRGNDLLTFPNYRNYCGKDTGYDSCNRGLPAEDCIDGACKRHDDCLLFNTGKYGFPWDQLNTYATACNCILAKEAFECIYLIDANNPAESMQCANWLFKGKLKEYFCCVASASLILLHFGEMCNLGAIVSPVTDHFLD